MIIGNSPYRADIVSNNPQAQRNTLSDSISPAVDTFHKSKVFSADDLSNIPAPIAETANNCAVVSKNLKKHYDKLYGKDNWEYVSIGRSCSKIADCLRFLGVDSSTIPISDLTNGVQSGLELCSKDGFEEYRNFIYGLGLNPDNIKNSTKKFIFQDYCDSGKSLKRFEEFIRSKDMGLDFENVIFESINSAFDNIFKAKEVDFDDFRKMMEFNLSLANQSSIRSIKTYTNIKKLPPNQLKRIVNGIEDACYVLNPDFENALKYFLKNI